MPLTHRNCRIPVKGLVSRVEGILSGNGTSCPVLMYQDNLPLSLSQMIVTSSYDRVFPLGYRVGRLEQRDNGTVQVRLLRSLPVL